MKKFNAKLLFKEQKNIRRRVLEISFESNLSHVGSCLSAIDLIDEVYKIKKKDEKFILSNGHAGIALYAVLEKNSLIRKKDIEKLHIHPDRNEKLNINVSTGSLGQGLPISVGMALANPNKNVYCMVSDGECAEGSIWEALRIAKDNKLHNLRIIINFNGWSGYGQTSFSLIENFAGFGYRVRKINGHNAKAINKALRYIPQDKPSIIFAVTNSDQFPFLKNQDAHYCTISHEDYERAIKSLEL